MHAAAVAAPPDRRHAIQRVQPRGLQPPRGRADHRPAHHGPERGHDGGHRHVTSRLPHVAPSALRRGGPEPVDGPIGRGRQPARQHRWGRTTYDVIACTSNARHCARGERERGSAGDHQQQYYAGAGWSGQQRVAWLRGWASEGGGAQVLAPAHGAVHAALVLKSVTSGG